LSWASERFPFFFKNFFLTGISFNSDWTGLIESNLTMFKAEFPLLVRVTRKATLRSRQIHFSTMGISLFEIKTIKKFFVNNILYFRVILSENNETFVYFIW
jgi:hypothetical protein